VSLHPEARTGPHVELTVTDTGSGMDSETLSRIFEPFFTTKDEGKGTGLGLPTVYGIVRQSGGSIDVHSEKGRGTTFRIYLPRTEAKAVVNVVGAPSETAMGSETILLVEDDPLLRCAVREQLEESGYRVLESASPWQAVMIAEAHRGSIDALVTDVMMPGLNGRDLANRLTPLRPEMSVVFMSGCTDEALVARGLLDLSQRLVRKPFSRESLLHAVRAAIAGHEPPSVRAEIA
jgi:CheY-like chemotaxis protein